MQSRRSASSKRTRSVQNGMRRGASHDNLTIVRRSGG
ncbi:hydrogenase expression protein [Pseudomonas syringae pv. actinidiae]|nr:hydrogenase expression protein [Pseudomonas syringae pv. actinidiae]